MIERTDMIGQLEEADRRMRASGLQRQWFAGADEAIFGVAGETNGALLEAILKATRYVDADCCNLLRHGACCHCVSHMLIQLFA